jgi:hypothetical protein
MPISLFKFFSGAQPQTVGNYSYAKKTSSLCHVCCVRDTHILHGYIALAQTQHDTERFTT